MQVLWFTPVSTATWEQKLGGSPFMQKVSKTPSQPIKLDMVVTLVIPAMQEA
jgi:hypothetical protein